MLITRITDWFIFATAEETIDKFDDIRKLTLQKKIFTHNFIWFYPPGVK